MNNKFNVLDDGLLINKVSKTYGNKKVVRDISISINRREVVGLLGPNGAGKTTTFYIIVGLVSCIIIYYLKDLSIALGKTNRIPLTLATWMPIIIIGLFSSVGILQINEK